MVPISSILGMVLTLLITLVAPIVLWVIIAKRLKGISKAIIAGALGFIISQVIIRIPLLQLISVNESVQQFSVDNKYMFILILAFSAALFESFGRLVVLKILSKNGLSYNGAFGAGFGHGMSEAILLIGLTYINNIVISVMINMNNLPQGEPYDSYNKIFLETDPALFYAAGIERIMTVLVHIGLTVLLAYMITRKKTIFGFILCIGIHTVLDFSVVSINSYTGNVWISLAVLLAFAVVSLMYIIGIKNKFIEKEMPIDPARKAVEEGY